MIAETDSWQAKTEFYYRYSSFLLQACRNRCKYFDGGRDLANDIFQNTMTKSFKGMPSLYHKVSGSTTGLDKVIKAWLSVIARNEFREFLRRNPDEKQLANSLRIKSEEIEIGYDPSFEENTENPKSTIEKQKLDSGLADLSEKERHILMVYMEYFDPNEPKRHLPDNVISELCGKYNTTSLNLRKIKSRALKKLMQITK